VDIYALKGIHGDLSDRWRGLHRKCHCRAINSKGERVVVLDDLVYGHRESIDADIPFYQGSAGDRGLLARIAKEHRIESCIHFASLISVGESEKNPAEYFENNVGQGISLLKTRTQIGS